MIITAEVMSPRAVVYVLLASCAARVDGRPYSRGRSRPLSLPRMSSPIWRRGRRLRHQSPGLLARVRCPSAPHLRRRQRGHVRRRPSGSRGDPRPGLESAGHWRSWKVFARSSSGAADTRLVCARQQQDRATSIRRRASAASVRAGAAPACTGGTRRPSPASLSTHCSRAGRFDRRPVPDCAGALTHAVYHPRNLATRMLCSP